MKMGIDGKPEDLLKDEQPNGGENEKESRNEKPTLRSRLESFWYFYKWHTLLGALLLFGLIISTVQFVRNVGPDAYIMYVGPSTLYVKDKDSMAAQASEYVTDHNYDNKKHVAFLDITVAVGENIPYTAYQTNVDANKRFIAELSAGDSVIYLLEESFFEIANEQGLLCPLDQIVDLNELPDNMYDKCAVRVGDLDFFKREGFSSVPDDTLLCIRRRPDDPERRESAYWYNNEKIVRNMLLYVR